MKLIGSRFTSGAGATFILGNTLPPLGTDLRLYAVLIEEVSHSIMATDPQM
jgi:hypothetical protein